MREGQWNWWNSSLVIKLLNNYLVIRFTILIRRSRVVFDLQFEWFSFAPSLIFQSTRPSFHGEGSLCWPGCFRIQPISRRARFTAASKKHQKLHNSIRRSFSFVCVLPLSLESFDLLEFSRGQTCDGNTAQALVNAIVTVFHPHDCDYRLHVSSKRLDQLHQFENVCSQFLRCSWDCLPALFLLTAFFSRGFFSVFFSSAVAINKDVCYYCGGIIFPCADCCCWYRCC